MKIWNKNWNNKKFSQKIVLHFKSSKLIYFSSSLLKATNEEDKIIFDKIHNYMTGFSDESNISDFCFDKNLYFPFAAKDKYLGYDRKFSGCFRNHHYHCSFGFGKIIYHFGPKGSGKSICGRATIFNYLHFKVFRGYKKVFFPAIFLT